MAIPELPSLPKDFKELLEKINEIINNQIAAPRSLAVDTLTTGDDYIYLRDGALVAEDIYVYKPTAFTLTEADGLTPLDDGASGNITVDEVWGSNSDAVTGVGSAPTSWSVTLSASAEDAAGAIVLVDDAGVVAAVYNGTNFTAKNGYTISQQPDVVSGGGSVTSFGTVTPLQFSTDPATLSVDYVGSGDSKIDGISGTRFVASPVFLLLSSSVAGSTTGTSVVYFGISRTFGELAEDYLISAVRGVAAGDVAITDVIADLKGFASADWDKLHDDVGYEFTPLKDLSDNFDDLLESYEFEHILSHGTSNDGLHKTIQQLDTATTASLYLLGLLAGRVIVQSFKDTYGGYDYQLLRIGVNCDDMSYRNYDLKGDALTIPQNASSANGIVATDKLQNQALLLELFRDVSAGADQTDSDNTMIRIYWYRVSGDEFVKVAEYKKQIAGQNILPSLYDYNSIILDEGSDQDGIIANTLSLQEWVRNNFIRKEQSSEPAYQSSFERSEIPIILGNEVSANKDQLRLKLASGSIHVSKGWMQLSRNTIPSEAADGGELLDATDVLAMPGYWLTFGAGTNYSINMVDGVYLAAQVSLITENSKFWINSEGGPPLISGVIDPLGASPRYRYEYWDVESGSWKYAGATLDRVVEDFAFGSGYIPYIGRGQTTLINGAMGGTDTVITKGGGADYACSRLRFEGKTSHHALNDTRAAIPGTLQLWADDGAGQTSLIALDDGAGNWVQQGSWVISLNGTIDYTRAAQNISLTLFSGITLDVPSIPDWDGGGGGAGSVPLANEIKVILVAEKDRLYLSQIDVDTLVRTPYGAGGGDPRLLWMTYSTNGDIPEGTIAGVRTPDDTDPPHYVATKQSLDDLRGQTIQWLKASGTEYTSWADAYEVTANSWYLNLAGNDIHLRFGYTGLGGPIASPSSYFQDAGEIVSKAYVDQVAAGAVISQVTDKTAVRRLPVRGPAYNPDAASNENISIDSGNENIVAIDIVINDLYGQVFTEDTEYYTQQAASFYKGNRGMLTVSPASYKTNAGSYESSVAGTTSAKSLRTLDSRINGVGSYGRYSGANMPGVRWHSLLLRERKGILGPSLGHIGDEADTFHLYPYRTDFYWGEGAGASRFGGTELGSSREFPIKLELTGSEFSYPTGASYGEITSTHRRLLIGSEGSSYSRVVAGVSITPPGFSFSGGIEWAHFDSSGNLVASSTIPAGNSVVAGKIDPDSGDITTPFEFSGPDSPPGGNVVYVVRSEKPRYFPSHLDKVLSRNAPITDTQVIVQYRVQSVNPSLLMRVFFMDEAMFHVELPMDLVSEAEYPTRVSHRKSFMFSIAQPVNILRNDFRRGFMVCRVAFACKQTGAAIVGSDLDNQWNVSAMTLGPPTGLATDKGAVADNDTFARHAIQLIDPFDFRYISPTTRNYGVYPPRSCNHEDAGGTYVGSSPTGGLYPVSNFALQYAAHIGDGGNPFSSPLAILDGVINWYPDYAGRRGGQSGLFVALGDFPSGETET